MRFISPPKRGPNTCAETPERLQRDEIVDRLPEDANWSDLAYEIPVRQKSEEGLRDLDEGRVFPLEEVRERFFPR